ncbi:MAG: helix-turn-helix domain-containing protein [Ilumatobacteraceae bacterium]
MTWRDEQAQRTRARILDTVNELLAEGHPANLTIPEVSRRSGVSIATIYRYFNTKEQLLDAVAFRGVTTPTDVERRAPDPFDMAPFLEELYEEMERIEPALRAQISTRLGQDVRRRRMSRHADMIAATMSRAGFDSDRPETKRLVRLIGILASSPVYLDQVDEPRGDVIADLAWAIRALARQQRDPSRPRPRNRTTDRSDR